MLEKWKFYYQGVGNTVENEQGEIIGTLEVNGEFPMAYGSTKFGEHLIVTFPNGSKQTCWRRKHTDNSYNIMPCSH